MPGSGGTQSQELKIFISYSRRDLAFADQLTAILEGQGFQVIIDRKGIYPALQAIGKPDTAHRGC